MRKISGHTLTELMVGVLLTAIIGIAVLYSIKNAHSVNRLEEQKKTLINIHKALVAQMRADLNAAVKVTGFSSGAGSFSGVSNVIPGIARIDSNGNLIGPRANPSDNDGLLIYATIYSQFSLPLQASQFNTDGTISFQDPSQVNDAYFHDISRYFQQVIQGNGILYFVNPNSSNIIPVASQSSNKVIPINQADFASYQSEVNGGVTTVNHLERIEWIVKNGQLIRRVWMTQPTINAAPTSQIVYATNLKSFQVNYTFHNQRTNTLSLQVPDPLQKLSHPQDPNYVSSGKTLPVVGVASANVTGSCTSESCCNPDNISTSPCVDWQDVNQIYVTFTYGSNYSVNANLASSALSADLGFKNDSGTLSLQATEVFAPENYSMKLSGEDLMGVSAACDVNNAMNRCKPECAKMFTNQNRNAPDWIGYGQYVGGSGGGPAGGASYYCRCGTPGNDPEQFLPPETSTGTAQIPGWTWPGADANGNALFNGVSTNSWSNSNKQIDACVRYFDIAYGENSRFNHPLGHVARNEASSGCFPKAGDIGMYGGPGNLYYNQFLANGGVPYSTSNDTLGIDAENTSTDDTVLRTKDSSGFYQYSYDPTFKQNILTPYLAWKLNPTTDVADLAIWSKHITCPSWYGSNCDGPFEQWFNLGCSSGQQDPDGLCASHPSSNPYQPWTDLCSCEDLSGPNVGLTCGLNSDANPACPQNIAAARGVNGTVQKTYRVDLTGSGNGLPSIEGALMCECLDYLKQNNKLPQLQANGTVDDSTADFRNPYGGSPPSTLSAISRTAYYENATTGSTTTTTGVCDQTLCDFNGYSLGCCTDPRQTCGNRWGGGNCYSNIKPQYYTAAWGGTGAQDYSSYCSSSCVLYDSAQMPDVQATRATLRINGGTTGTDYTRWRTCWDTTQTQSGNLH